jgi:hypothetical protein
MFQPATINEREAAGDKNLALTLTKTYPTDAAKWMKKEMREVLVEVCVEIIPMQL